VRIFLGCATESWRACHARFQRLPSHRIALPARTKQTANTVVADFSSQSSHRLRPPPACRGAFRRGYLSLRFCSYRDSLMRFVAQIARLSAGLCRWHAHQTPTPTARRIALRPGRRARGAMHRDQRLNTPPARSWKARCNRLPTAVPMRSPPYEARASPRPQSRTTQDVTFRTDQVLRRHSCGTPWARAPWPAASLARSPSSAWCFRAGSRFSSCRRSSLWLNGCHIAVAASALSRRPRRKNPGISLSRLRGGPPGTKPSKRVRKVLTCKTSGNPALETNMCVCTPSRSGR
jgi:hypothetical protein